MKKLSLNTIFIFLFSSTVFCQVDTLWTKTYGTTATDGANAVCETNDGGFVLAGYTYSQGLGNLDIYLVRTNNQGNQVYSGNFGGSGWEIAYSVCNALDNSGYIIAGYTTSAGAGSKDVFILKVDQQLNQEWFKTYGGTALDVGKSVIACSDNSYIICGYTESFGAGEDDVYLIKTDANGDSIWTKTIGCSKSDMGHSVYETSDGHLLIAGSTGLYDTPGVASGRNSDIYIVKTDLDGNVVNSQAQWCIAGNQGAFDAGTSICETREGNYCVVGMSSAEGVEVMDFSIIKTDSSLNSIWKKRKEAGYYDFAYSVCENTNDGGLIVCGKLNIASSSKSDLFIVKLDTSGNEVWRQIYGGAQNDGGRCIKRVSNGDYIIAGQTSSFGKGSYDMWLLKIEDVPLKIDNKNPDPVKSFRLNQNYPNPFNPETIIDFYLPQHCFVELSVFDVSGKKVRTLVNEKLPVGNHSVSLDLKEQASGIYFCTLNSEDHSQTRKLLYLK